MHTEWIYEQIQYSVCVCVCCQMVKTTRGPNLAAGVSSPALTNGAISLLQQNLTQEERELWGSLGANWTQAKSVLQVLAHFSPKNHTSFSEILSMAAKTIITPDSTNPCQSVSNHITDITF